MESNESGFVSPADLSACIYGGRGRIEPPAIEIVTNRNAGFLIPRQWIGALQDVPIEELGKLEV